MPFAFKLPDLGEGVAEGEVVRWMVREGDEVTEDQPLVEVLTDKATVEIPSPRAGRVLRLGAAEGERVPVGHVLIEIEEGVAVEPSAAPAAVEESTAPAAGAAEAGPSFSPTVRPAAKEAAGLLRAVEATPAVRALARELGVDLTQVEGHGRRRTHPSRRREARRGHARRARRGRPGTGHGARDGNAGGGLCSGCRRARARIGGRARVPLRGLRRGRSPRPWPSATRAVPALHVRRRGRRERGRRRSRAPRRPRPRRQASSSPTSRTCCALSAPRSAPFRCSTRASTTSARRSCSRSASTWHRDGGAPTASRCR